MDRIASTSPQQSGYPSSFLAAVFRPTFSDDLPHGQIVIVWARWILVLSGLVFALWNPGPIGELRVQLMVILALAVANFYLHAQILMQRPVLSSVIYIASVADMAAISLLVISEGGFESTLYIFYFPALLAVSVAFSAQRTLHFAGAVILLYGFITFVGHGIDGRAALEHHTQITVTRLLMLGAVAFCGATYRHLEGVRRREAAEAQDAVLSQIHQSATAQ